MERDSWEITRYLYEYLVPGIYSASGPASRLESTGRKPKNKVWNTLIITLQSFLYRRRSHPRDVNGSCRENFEASYWAYSTSYFFGYLPGCCPALCYTSQLGNLRALKNQVMNWGSTLCRAQYKNTRDGCIQLLKRTCCVLSTDNAIIYRVLPLRVTLVPLPLNLTRFYVGMVQIPLLID